LQNIEEWLTALRLEKYIPAFEEAEIDLDTLPDLAEDDLKELGLPLGPRRKVWGAISRLGEAIRPDAEISAGAALPETTPSESSASSDAERRHLTVMFVDLVGSTEMATKIDPEDMRNVITGYQNTVAGVVSRYEGFVAKFMGDGVLCYFGWPRANEDDAERAVRAGLDIISTVKNISGPDKAPLASRVGIASGIVIVGDLIGSGATQEAAVVGETPNLAARLQDLAQPDQLVLPKETISLLGNVFELEPIGAHALKGIAEPVDAYVVVGDATRESRFDARQSGTLAPIVGREQELTLMRECWVRAKAGAGQMILIKGEAGIGKSRITRAVIDEVAQDDHVRMTYQCSPYHTDSAFYPVVQQMSFAAGIKATDGTDARLDKLEALIGDDVEIAKLMAPLLGIDAIARHGALELSPAQQRARTMQALCELTIQQSQNKPLLLVFEDLHWIDPTSLELLELLLNAITAENILVLSTARPTFEYGFGGHPIVNHFALNRLGLEQVASIVAKLTNARALPDEVMQIIGERTDGVPLFVEELTKTILESGVLKEVGDRLVLSGPLDALAIPSTLHDSLMARLDRLQPIKEVAQTAACIGREFAHELLTNISPLSEAELNSALEGLIKAELIYRRGIPPEANYLFKHALVRDAAYESLLKERRGAIHSQILLALEADPDIAPEILAVHAEAAGKTERAIDLWETASKIAIARPAYDEGLSHLRRAIALIMPRADANDSDALDKALTLQVQVGVTCMARKGWGADETKAAFEGALVLADKIGETPLRFSILYGLNTVRYLRADTSEAVQHGEALLQLAENAPITAPAVVANRSYGITLLLAGRFTDAQIYLERAFALFDPEQHLGLEGQYGQDLGIGSNCFLACNLEILGESQKAAKHFQNAVGHLNASSHINSICYMHMVSTIFSLIKRDELELARHASVLASLSAEHTLEWFHQVSSVAEALLLADSGDVSGITNYLKADKLLVGMKSLMMIPWFRVEAGRRALGLGLLEQAHRLASTAQELMDETGERFGLIDFHCLKAALALADGDSEAGEHSLNKAVEVAREKRTKMWELRASIDLARLWQDQDRRNEAVALLKPIHDSIADGDCPKDRSIAADLLNDLAR
jgi:class 3 adenylate cyclase/tetratricopeptide (TPR) repeat protein/ABC-type transport system involved in cytochrome c biogenesis ATPase subunit